jgi:GTPase
VPASYLSRMIDARMTDDETGAGPARGHEDEETGTGAGEPTRAGFVAIVGRPNAGKSTLLNAILGEHLSIVTPRAQTTWVPVSGILTRGDTQVVFVDTPGLLSNPKDLMHRALLEAVHQGARDADGVLVLLDPTRHTTDEAREALASAVRMIPAGRVVVAVNKCDVAPAEAVEVELAWARERLGLEGLRISARSGEGVGELEHALLALVPPGPFLFPEDELATAPVRFFVGELVRETVFERFRDEIPWAVLPKVEAFRQATGPGDRTYIEVTLHVERASQKGILIGEGGTMIRRIGSEARAKIEGFLGEPVFLQLWVKVLPRWRKKKGELRRLGLPVPEVPDGA